ncbi:hydroxylamine reductase, partial [Clostridium sp. D2Q-11]
MSMFCYQCQEAAKGTGCTKVGVCGKSPEVANLQDLLIFTLKGISIYSTKGRELGIRNKEVDHFIVDSLFSTITNANFDRNTFIKRINKALELRETMKKEIVKAGGEIEGGFLDKIKNALGLKSKAIIELENFHDAATWSATSEKEFDEKSKTVGILATENEDIRSLRELLIYGLKGMAAYLHHANNLNHDKAEINGFLQKALVATLDDSLTADDLVALNMEAGKFGVDVMALLDTANTSKYGHPEITKVNIGVKNNPAILISGHDLSDMEQLLEQTKGTGVDIYTHSEMLPANYYPAFKKYDHFVGNYGNAWWKQDKEFASFNGPILMTTNCLVPPKASYRDRVYTTGAVGFEGLTHIEKDSNGNKDFSKIIAHAKKCKSPTEIEKGEIVGGFAHNQVMQLADKVVDAVKTGAIKRFFVMAGCDGRMKSRDYY